MTRKWAARTGSRRLTGCAAPTSLIQNLKNSRHDLMHLQWAPCSACALAHSLSGDGATDPTRRSHPSLWTQACARAAGDHPAAVSGRAGTSGADVWSHASVGRRGVEVPIASATVQAPRIRSNRPFPTPAHVCRSARAIWTQTEPKSFSPRGSPQVKELKDSKL